MPKSPCQDCPYRKVTCHDQCDDYIAYHDALVEARKALNKASDSIGVLLEGYISRKQRWHRSFNK